MAFQKTENHAYFVTIHFVHYNFVRIHKSLRMTPAMAARVTDKLRSIADMVKLIENRGALRDGTLLAGAALNENNFARYMDPVGQPPSSYQAEFDTPEKCSGAREALLQDYNRIYNPHPSGPQLASGRPSSEPQISAVCVRR